MGRISVLSRALGALLVGALACGGMLAATTTAGAATSTTPVKVMLITDVTSQSLGFANPEGEASAKAALKGTDVQLEVCDSKGTAADGEACAKKAVNDGVTAVILGFAQGTTDILKAAGIPVVGNSSTTDSNSFAVSSPAALYAANGVALGKSGCKKLGILYLAGTDSLVDFVKKGAASAGAKEVARAAIAANEPDLAPAISKLTGAGATCVALSVIPSQVAQAVTAINQSGKKLTMAAVSAIVTPDVLQSLGDLANGILIVDAQQNPADISAGMKKVTKQIKAVDSSADVTEVGLIDYIGGRLIAAALKTTTGDVTTRNAHHLAERLARRAGRRRRAPGVDGSADEPGLHALLQPLRDQLQDRERCSEAPGHLLRPRSDPPERDHHHPHDDEVATRDPPHG